MISHDAKNSHWGTWAPRGFQPWHPRHQLRPLQYRWLQGHRRWECGSLCQSASLQDRHSSPGWSEERILHSQSVTHSPRVTLNLLDCFIKGTFLEILASISTRQDVTVTSLPQIIWVRKCMLFHCWQCVMVQLHLQDFKKGCRDIEKSENHSWGCYKSVYSTWWMMPEPGFQKPTPYLAAEVARKLYTSWFTSCVTSY